MEQPTILTDDEVNRLNEIRRTHEYPVHYSKETPPTVLANVANIRNKQRGELLGMVDKLLAGIREMKRGVAWENAHHFADMVDRLSAENAKLKHDNGELRCINQALRADVEGMGVAAVNLRGELHVVRVDLLDTKAKLDHALKGLAQANGRELRVIKFSDHARYNVEIKPERGFKGDFGGLEYTGAKIMNLADLVKRYNQIAAAMADNSEG